MAKIRWAPLEDIRTNIVLGLMRGKLSGFSLDNLYSMAQMLGLRPELRWSSAA